MNTQKPSFSLHGTITVPGDKSISHRSVMFGSIARGTTRVSGFLNGADCLSTISCFRKLGVAIEQDGASVTIRGNGMRGLVRPQGPLDCGNSGTTTRLISGILAAQNFTTVLTGDASIQKRPMDRIIRPLSLMGADIRSLSGNGCAPLQITGQALHGIRYESPVASAQVKSAVLLAGLYADGPTSVTEPSLSRDHTERMLRSFGADVKTVSEPSGRPVITVSPASELTAADISVPGDISSAAYFIAAALMVPGSDLLIRHVGINPTRDGIIEVVKQMGGYIEVLPANAGGAGTSGTEPCADLRVRYSRLNGAEIGGSQIPRLIDELPVIAALAATAEGTTVIRDAAELKVKESNRIRVMTEELKKLGASVTETEDGMIIHGGRRLSGAAVNSHKDHRIAMTFAVLDLITEDRIEISDRDCVAISYPGFYEDLKSLT